MKIYCKQDTKRYVVKILKMKVETYIQKHVGNVNCRP